MKTPQTLSRKSLIREQAENDLLSFIRLVHPGRVLGLIHEEVINWWCSRNSYFGWYSWKMGRYPI